MKTPSIVQRLFVTLFAVLQLTLPGLAGVSLCSLGLPSENCCCEVEDVQATPSCCSMEVGKEAPAPIVSRENLETDCDCARSPQPGPVEYPVLSGMNELAAVAPPFLSVSVDRVQPAPERPMAGNLALWPPGSERPLRVLLQVFRL